MCRTDIREDAIETWLKPLAVDGFDAIERSFADMTSRVRARLATSGFSSSDLTFEPSFDLRYIGQQWALPVTAKALDVEAIRADFEARHQRQFGHIQPNGQIEIVHLRLTGIARLSQVEHRRLRMTDRAPEPYERRDVHLESGFLNVSVYDGNRMQPGQTLDGPALIEESNTTILIGSGDRLEVDANHNFLIHVAPAGGASR